MLNQLTDRASHWCRLSVRNCGICARATRLTVLLLAAAGVVLLSLVSTRPLRAQTPTPTATPTTLMRISPPTQTVSAGSDVVVDVLVDDVTNLGAYEFTLSFNPSVLSFVSFSNGPFLGSSGRSVTCLPPLLDVDVNGDTIVDPGFARVGCTTLGPTPDGPTGSGLLATVTLSTSCAASSDLDLARVGLGDILGTDIPTQTSGGSATVSDGAPCPTPSPTPMTTPPGLVGDADCDRTVTSIDATVILQLTAGLLDTLPCRRNADPSQDGTIDAIDATLILQYVAGLLDSLPP